MNKGYFVCSANHMIHLAHRTAQSLLLTLITRCILWLEAQIDRWKSLCLAVKDFQISYLVKWKYILLCQSYHQQLMAQFVSSSISSFYNNKSLWHGTQENNLTRKNTRYNTNLFWLVIDNNHTGQLASPNFKSSELSSYQIFVLIIRWNKVE